MRYEREVSLQSRFRSARFGHAVLRWESAVLVGITTLAVPAALIAGDLGVLPGWAWVPCLLFGLSAEGALVYASATDPESNRRVVAELLHNHYGSQRLRDDAVRQHVVRAFDYRARIEAVLLGRSGSPARSALDQTVLQIDGWLSNICRLAERLDLFLGEAVFQRADKLQVQERVEELREKAETNTDEKVQRKIRETLASRKHQLRTIEELEHTIERGQLQLEHAVAALGAICTQTVLLCAQGVEVGAAHLLSQEISEEAQQVDAILSAMERAYDMDLDIGQP